MGHWSEDIFGGDGGCDFFVNLCDKTGTQSLDYLIENLEISDGYLDIEEADAIIIISFIVIGFVNREYVKNSSKDVLNDYFKGKVEAYLDKNQELWLEKYELGNYGPNHDLSIYQYCFNDIERILDPKLSEAYELWAENQSAFSTWKSTREGIQQEIKKLIK